MLINKMTSAASSPFMCGSTLAELLMAELVMVELVPLLLGFA
jgi:hypothetical protein